MARLPTRPGRGQRLATAPQKALGQRLRAARRDAALGDPATALLAGGTVIAAAAAYVGGLNGWLAPGVWLWGPLAGLTVTAVKLAFDIADRSADGELLRSLLAQDFGPDLAGDTETSRQARLAIEMRVRLEQPATAATGHAGLMADTDAWLAVIVRLAGQVARLKGEARFQAGLAARGRARLGDVTAQARASADPAQARRLTGTAEAIAAQVSAQEAYLAFVEDSQLRLERAVSGFGTICAQVALVLARGDTDTAALSQAVTQGIAGIEGELATLARHPPLPAAAAVALPLDPPAALS